MAAASQELRPRKNSEQLLQNFRKSHDVAGWYRMLSINQVYAILSLTNALRDDGEQGSTYRVHTCLTKLGISPLIGRRWLKKLINMSRGSDVAFLYFLWEGFYKCKRTEYTYNEQVLMSSIMHLDLDMTLNELERILPPGHPSVEKQARLDRKNKLEKQLTRPFRQPTPSKKINRDISPYFWRQPRPKQFFNSKISRKNDIAVNFPFWPSEGEPTYRVCNANRWFASYQLNPIRSEIYRMLTVILDDWHKSYDNHHITEIDKKMLCDIHREALRQKELIRDELIIKAHKNFLELLDVSAKENKERRKRIVDQLNKDVEEYAQQWEKLKGMQYTETMLVKDCKLCEYSIVKTDAQDNKLKCLIGMDDYNPIGHLKTEATSPVTEIRDKDAQSRCKFDQVSDPEEHCKLLPHIGDAKRSECPIHLRRPLKRSCAAISPRCIAFSKTFEAIDETIAKRSTHSKYFSSPQLHQPYRFHYHQTFHQCCAPLEPIQVIHRQTLKSLQAFPEPVLSGKTCTCREPAECTRANVIQAIVQCAEAMWQNSLKSYEKKCTEPSRELSDPCVTKCKTDINLKHLPYNRSYYDPDDQKLMETMLRDGMSVLRQDPRFVFASFPDSHKIIMLREWIKRRYGKTYSQREIAATMKYAGLAFRAVINLQQNPPAVDLRNYRNEKTNYINRGKMDRMAKELTSTYNRALNEKLMHHTAFCWSFMGAQYWKGGHGTNNFYAYLPAKNDEVLRVRPWAGAKRNMIDARRQRELRAEMRITL